MTLLTASHQLRAAASFNSRCTERLDCLAVVMACPFGSASVIFVVRRALDA
jgi:hypothetical protein